MWFNGISPKAEHNTSLSRILTGALEGYTGLSLVGSYTHHSVVVIATQNCVQLDFRLGMCMCSNKVLRAGVFDLLLLHLC